MNTPRIRPWLIAATIALPAAIAMGVQSDVRAGNGNGNGNGYGNVCSPQHPDEYEPFIVFVANGEYPDTEPQGLFGDLYFFTDVMGWDQQTIDDWRADKLALLASKVGIVDPENHPDLQVLMGTTNPVIDYHVLTFSGRKVPPSGWEVREGFLIVVVTNPAGLTLGGEYAGEHVEEGTIIGGGGLYNIEVTDKQGNVTGEEIVFDFTTVTPVQPVIGGRAAFSCEVESDQFGSGRAQGINALEPIGGGMLKANVRNVVTFSDDDGL